MNDNIASIFGYCGLINIGFMMFWFIAVLIARKTIIKMHSTLFAIDETQIIPIHYQLMGMFKLINVLFFITPWIVLTYIIPA
ncbi:hypothetical protein NBRC116188_00380 [Oceaniserpentilla sp. 4NH20-0058]|uniref:DUF6868 family protein n=1 Tax=Oceaniserpentilla sp. 4NH20-0058 TaxID=3127660 RepID=UPI00310C131A